MNRWVASGIGLLAALAIVGTTVLAIQMPVLEKPSREGVLLPEVLATEFEGKTKPTPIEPDKLKEEHLTYRAVANLKLDIHEIIDPNSFVPKTPGLVIERQVIEPIYQAKEDKMKPLSLALVLDNSWSMIRVNPRNQEPPQDPLYRRLDAAKMLMGSLRPIDMVTLGVFPPRRSKIPVDYPPATPPVERIIYRQPPATVQSALDSLRGEENGTTPLYRGINDGIILAGKNPDTRAIVVALTDGKDTEEIPGSFAQLLDTIKMHPNTKLYIIVLGENADVPLLKQLTPDVIEVKESEKLKNAFKSIQTDIQQELIGSRVTLFLRRVDEPFQEGEGFDVNYKVKEKAKDLNFKLGEGKK